MAYTPFKMRSSPMKRNFGIGEKEEISPSKNILGKVLAGVGESLAAAADAGAGTSNLATAKAKKESEKTKEEKLKNEKLKHERAMELMKESKKMKETKEEREERLKEEKKNIASEEGIKLSSEGEMESLIEDFEEGGIYEGKDNLPEKE